MMLDTYRVSPLLKEKAATWIDSDPDRFWSFHWFLSQLTFFFSCCNIFLTISTISPKNILYHNSWGKSLYDLSKILRKHIGSYPVTTTTFGPTKMAALASPSWSTPPNLILPCPLRACHGQCWWAREPEGGKGSGRMGRFPTLLYNISLY